MTVKQARKVLGKHAKHVTDEQLKKDIEIAELFKNLFFNSYTQSEIKFQATN